jgi:uncharacterized membrane protein YedE/YeeE
MSNFLGILIGIFLGIIFMKAEVLSCFRIQEMFALQSFRMYGIIGSAIAVGALSVWIIRKAKAKSIEGNRIELNDKAPNFKSAYIGGTIFGLGWAMTSACPGPMYALVGSGTTVFLNSIIIGILGGAGLHGIAIKTASQT